MKILVIGLGRCGGRLADEFGRLNGLARSRRGLEIVTGDFAVSADAADLVDLTSIRGDYRHRILIGAERFQGQGIGGDNELGAQVMREHAETVLVNIREVKQFFETDIILVIAGAAGGTGSGGLPVLVQHIKERFPEKCVGAMVVLPFERETRENPDAVINTAVCLKSVASVADAVILVDNNRYREEDAVPDDFAGANRAITEPFFNLLCAGAEKRKAHIGARLLDAGDIIQTLGGWTVLGSGRINLPVGLAAIVPGKAVSGPGRGVKAMDEAIEKAAWLCRPGDAATALYLVSAPAKEINFELIKALGDYLKNAAPNAIIRSGDYPVGRGLMEVTVILSRLSDVPKVRDFYTRSVALSGEEKEEPEQETSS
jgi:cell division GTPase FtsZ